MSAHCHDCGTDLVHGRGDDWQLMTCPVCTLRSEVAKLTGALEQTDNALRNVLGGVPVRNADEILAANAFLLFASPVEAK